MKKTLLCLIVLAFMGLATHTAAAASTDPPRLTAVVRPVLPNTNMLFQAPVVHSVTLSWTPNPSTLSTGQNVYKAQCSVIPAAGQQCPAASTGAFSKITSTPLGAQIATFVDTAVIAKTSYVYYLTALCPSCDIGSTESVPSNKVTVVIPGDGVINPPTGLGAVTVALSTSGSKSYVAGAWSDAPLTKTTYELSGQKKWFVFTYNTTLLKGTMTNSVGKYNIAWSGGKVAKVQLRVCDAQGCLIQTD